MSLVGLDLNSTRALAIAGPRLQALSLLCLDGTRAELPLALSLEEKQVQVGRAGLALTRLGPHLACLDFLAHLGVARAWSAGRHQIDAAGALALVLDTLEPILTRATGLVLALPAYLNERQLDLIHGLARDARLRLIGSVAAPLAAALAHLEDLQEQEPTSSFGGSRYSLVVDVDGHALTWSIVERTAGFLQLRLCQPAPHLNRNLWLRRLLDCAAHRCVRQSRRDPRESAETEQSLHEQIADVLACGPPSGLVQLRIQGQQWYHHLMLTPEDLVAFVSPLLRQSLAELEAILTTVASLGGLEGVVVTDAAASLPGLVPALQARLDTLVRGSPVDEEADYGDHLLSSLSSHEPVRILAPDAVAAAAHTLAVRIHKGEIKPGRVGSIPLSGSGAHLVDPGPARINFRGQDHILSRAPFTLGRDPSCDLVFESDAYPHVSGRHCEIVQDRRGHTLCDRSRHGTLLNDRLIDQQAALHSGDWIRLGPCGPVLRFLGQTTIQ